MKKLLLTLASIMVLGFSFANANPIDSMNTPSVSINSSSTLSNADEAMLFGSKANAVVLDNEEMKNTQGFGFWSNVGNWFNNQKDWLIPVATIGGIAGCAAILGPTCTLGLAF